MTDKKKPRCKLVGQDGNVFTLIGLARRALKQANQNKEASDMAERCFKAHSYDEALQIITEYVGAY